MSKDEITDEAGTEAGAEELDATDRLLEAIARILGAAEMIEEAYFRDGRIHPLAVMVQKKSSIISNHAPRPTLGGIVLPLEEVREIRKIWRDLEQESEGVPAILAAPPSSKH